MLESKICPGEREVASGSAPAPPLDMNVVLLSTYELGRQPFGLASPAAWLREAGADVSCQDLAVEPLDEKLIATADLVAFHVPMHTATRLASAVVPRIQRLNPGAHLCFYGLYAPLNESFLRSLGADTILGGEFEKGLVEVVERWSDDGSGGDAASGDGASVSLARQRFRVPEREDLPPLESYARLRTATGEEQTVGYTEATRGCKHLCRHCPIVPVYQGAFRVVQPEVVLEDVRQQVARGAQHITFGDPDFFNGPSHAARVVEDLHREFPEVGYDVTIKVEHLLHHADLLPTLRDTGCVFITSAVESVDEGILRRLDKGHSQEDFEAAVELCRDLELCLNPTFVTFTPWTSRVGYLELLSTIERLDLIGSVSPVQYGIRLLITPGSKLLELDEVQRLVGDLDPERLVYPWCHPDPAMDDLFRDVTRSIDELQKAGDSRRDIFEHVWGLAVQLIEGEAARELRIRAQKDRARVPATVPYLTEPWYC